MCNINRVLYDNSTTYNNGYQHFVEITFNSIGQFVMKVNHSKTAEIQINAVTNCQFQGTHLYFGGRIPSQSSTGRRKREADPVVDAIMANIVDFTNITNYKGTVQDAQINDNSLQFYQPNDANIVTIPKITLGDSSGLQQGEQSDDTCSRVPSPCLHDGNCSNKFFNDFT